MKYKINFERTRDILHEYGLAYFRDDKYIYVRTEWDTKRVMKLEENDGGFDDFVEAVKNGELNEYCGKCAQLIIKILHPHFDECFEKVRNQCSLTKVRKFLEDLKYKTDDKGVYYNSYYGNGRVQKNGRFMSWKYIIRWLNGSCDSESGYYDAILTLLENNKDKLLEDE